MMNQLLLTNQLTNPVYHQVTVQVTRMGCGSVYYSFIAFFTVVS